MLEVKLITSCEYVCVCVYKCMPSLCHDCKWWQIESRKMPSRYRKKIKHAETNIHTHTYTHIHKYSSNANSEKEEGKNAKWNDIRRSL